MNNQPSRHFLTSCRTSVFFSDACIKGPLAFAATNVFSLDPSFPEFYDSNSPILTAITDQFAQASSLSVPGDTKPPYILTIGGSQAVDLNTGMRPVIETLTTVITSKMLASNKTVYATPLTTLTYQMARSEAVSNTGSTAFEQSVGRAGDVVSEKFALDQGHIINIFSSPVVINERTDTLAEQEEAIYHRAALEAFAAKVHQLSSRKMIQTDLIIGRVELDIESDGVIDDAANGTVIGGIDPVTLNHDPMKLVIPNTAYLIEDIITLMKKERAAIRADAGTPINLIAL